MDIKLNSAFKARMQKHAESANDDVGQNVKYIQFKKKADKKVIRLLPFSNKFDPFLMGAYKSTHKISSDMDATKYACPVHNNHLYQIDSITNDPLEAEKLKTANAEILKKRKCPFCDAVKVLWEDGDDASKEIKDIRSLIGNKKRYYYLAIDRSKQDEGVKIFSTGIKVKKQLDNFFFNPEYCKEDMTEHLFHIQNGYDLTITKTINSMNYPEYAIMPSKHATPAGTEKDIASYLEQIKSDKDFDLLGFCSRGIKSYDELQEILNNPQASDSGTPSIDMDKIKSNFSAIAAGSSNSNDTPKTPETQEESGVEEAKMKLEIEAKMKLEVEAKMKAEIEAKVKAEIEAKVKLETEARIKAEVEAKMKAESEEVKTETSDTVSFGNPKPLTKEAVVNPVEKEAVENKETGGDDIDDEFAALLANAEKE